MNKHEFIKKLLSRFSFYVEKDPEGAFYDTYTRILTNKVDYDKLWDKFVNEYDEKTPPTGVYIKKLAQSCLNECDLTLNPNNNWVTVKLYNPKYGGITKTAMPKGTTEEQAIKAHEKKFNCTGFKIIKIN